MTHKICSDCKTQLPKAGTCEDCKRMRRIMYKIRRLQATFDTPEKKAERARRIPIYARLVEANFELFHDA